MESAKRVILRVREADFEEDDMFKPVRLYLEKMGRSFYEIEENRHYIHFQPSNAHIPQRDPKIHIIIDLNHEQFSGDVVDKDFPHEIYGVRRVDNKLALFAYRHAENILRVARSFTDDTYPWGQTKADLRGKTRAEIIPQVVVEGDLRVDSEGNQ